MAKHTLLTRGLSFTWNDDDREYTHERQLLELYSYISGMHAYTTYIGEDPYKAWNDHIKSLQDEIIDWIIEMREADNANS